MILKLLEQVSLTNSYITKTTQEKGGNVLHDTVVLFKSLHTWTPTLLYSLDHA
jgi:hypothetical protein